jgi:DNA-binding MarR family transcriptional regulator
MSTNSIGIGSSADVLEAFRALRRALSRAAAATFSDTGVGTKQVQILREIRTSGSVSQVDLARTTLTDPAGMMRALDALERRGWVQRSSCEDDRRRKLVSLTAEGRRAVGELDATYESLRRLANGALSSADRRQFCALVAKLAVTLEAAAVGVPMRENA